MATPQPFLVQNPSFAPLKKPTTLLAKAVDPDAGTKKVCVVLDGVLAPPRTGREIAEPLAGAMDWVLSLHESGLEIFILDPHRPATFFGHGWGEGRAACACGEFPAQLPRSRCNDP